GLSSIHVLYPRWHARLNAHRFLRRSSLRPFRVSTAEFYRQFEHPPAENDRKRSTETPCVPPPENTVRSSTQASVRSEWSHRHWSDDSFYTCFVQLLAIMRTICRKKLFIALFAEQSLHLAGGYERHSVGKHEFTEAEDGRREGDIELPG